MTSNRSLAALALLLAGCGVSQPAPHAASSPEAAPSSAAPSEAVAFEQIRPGVWLHTATRETNGFGTVTSNGLVLASGTEALLVNTPWGADPNADTEALLRRATQVAGVPVRRAVGTHFHGDSVDGIAALQRASVPLYTTVLTAQLMAGAGLPRPDSLFAANADNVWTLRYGDRAVEVFFPGPGHTADNAVVFVPEARLLFGGCLIRPGETESMGNTADADLALWAESVARVKARYEGRVDVVVPTHGPPGGPELLDHTIRVVQTGRRALGG